MASFSAYWRWVFSRASSFRSFRALPGAFPPIITAMKRIACLAAILAALVSAALARDFVMPKLVPAITMASRDNHPQEKMTVGADAYDTAAKASIFHPAMLQHSVLPVLVVFTNDGDETVVLSHVHFELVTRDRAKAEPYTMDDLQRAFTAIRAPAHAPRTSCPIPLPGRSKAHGGLPQKDRDELEHASFAARAVETRQRAAGLSLLRCR